MGFVNRMDQNVAKYRIGITLKKWEWSPFVWMVGAILQGVWLLYRINNDKGNVVNAVFLKYSKEGKLSLSHVGIWNIQSDACYDDTKHYQLNPFKYLRWSVFA